MTFLLFLLRKRKREKIESSLFRVFNPIVFETKEESSKVPHNYTRRSKEKVMTNTKSNEGLAKEQQNKKKQKELVDLECDDEFEEFNEEGIIITFKIVSMKI